MTRNTRNTRNSQKEQIQKGKEEKSQHKIQKESRTKENIIKQKKEQYNQEESQSKESTKRDGDKDINRSKENRQASELQQQEQQRKEEKQKKRKIRRSKKIKNALKDFKVFYQNVRGMKSKIDASNEAIDDYKPSLIYLVETHLAKEEQTEIPGYKICRNDDTKNSKGILVAVRNSIKTISIEVSRYDELCQTLWILLNNQKQKIRIGAISGPQENMTPNNELKLLYKTIAEQIAIAKKKYQQVLMVGDFNVKIVNYIPGNKESVSKGRRQLKSLIEKYNLKIINANENKCKGKWTREKEEERSRIDYVITSQEYTWKPFKVWR